MAVGPAELDIPDYLFGPASQFSLLPDDAGGKTKLEEVEEVRKTNAFQEYIAEQGIRLRQPSACSPLENGVEENFKRQLRMRLSPGFVFMVLNNGNHILTLL